MGDALVQHPLTRKISFTGSTAVGSRIMQLAARDIKRVSLELGGKSPNIIFADADVEKAAATSPMSVFANTGQDCCARSRVFVERPVYEKFVELFVQATRKIVVDDPAKVETQIGPLVSGPQRESVEAFLPNGQIAASQDSLRGRPSRAQGLLSQPGRGGGMRDFRPRLARGDFWAGGLHSAL
jgi:acyl-CoA reductase-like NAD-dependent aldehyde dehydrogenase